MARKLASVQEIVDIRPIEKADAIEVAQVLGWECVVRKDEKYSIGEKVIYIEVDSILPDKPEFAFLKDRKFRIRTIKLRGQVSQGLILPLSVLPVGNYKEGCDVTDLLEVRKYDPQAEAERKLAEEKLRHSKNKISKFLSRYPWYRRLIFKPKKDRFPGFIKKTDEPRIQLFPNICDEEKDTPFTVSEKVDGTSSTFFLLRNPKKWYQFKCELTFGVCSRNVYLRKEDDSHYWKIARQYDVENVLKKIIGDNEFVVLQGEIIGEGVQGNKYNIKGLDFYAFNLIYPDGQLHHLEMEDTLRQYGIKCVPMIKQEFKLKDTIHDMVEYAKGKSVIAPVLREGIVVRNYYKGISFKVINPDFLLKHGE